MTRAWLGLGANIGNRAENLRAALRWLAPGCTVAAVSSLYESEALVPEGEPPGPPYLNAACAVETALPAEELLAAVKRIEHEMGRRPGPRWAARPLDIDILLYGDAVIDTPTLTIPHPRIAERAFVLAPLAEIAGGVTHPALGRTIADLAAAAATDGLRRVAGAAWAAGIAPEATRG